MMMMMATPPTTATVALLSDCNHGNLCECIFRYNNLFLSKRFCFHTDRYFMLPLRLNSTTLALAGSSQKRRVQNDANAPIFSHFNRQSILDF